MGHLLGKDRVEAIDVLLQQAVGSDASDIHLKVGSPPVMRVDGELRRMDESNKLRPADIQQYAESIFTPKAATDFKAKGAADFGYGRPELGRFRVSAFRQRGSVSMILRRVTPDSKSFSELGLPKVVEKVAADDSGLVLITGPTGSGKTTTMAAIIDWINSNRNKAIITIEDPIEVLHPDKQSVVAQREVGVDTPDMAGAIKSAMRHDCDVILVSELGDKETAKAAIDAAETGHLVISSMRTTDPADTINRIAAMFTDSDKRVVRAQLAAEVLAVVSQSLVETKDSGMVLASEVMTNNERVQEWILGIEEPSFLVEVIKESGFHGMHTLDTSLLEHVVAGIVDLDVALTLARNKHELRAKALAAGVSG